MSEQANQEHWPRKVPVPPPKPSKAAVACPQGHRLAASALAGIRMGTANDWKPSEVLQHMLHIKSKESQVLPTPPEGVSASPKSIPEPEPPEATEDIMSDLESLPGLGCMSDESDVDSSSAAVVASKYNKMASWISDNALAQEAACESTGPVFNEGRMVMQSSGMVTQSPEGEMVTFEWVECPQPGSSEVLKEPTVMRFQEAVDPWACSEWGPGFASAYMETKMEDAFEPVSQDHGLIKSVQTDLNRRLGMMHPPTSFQGTPAPPLSTGVNASPEMPWDVHPSPYYTCPSHAPAPVLSTRATEPPQMPWAQRSAASFPCHAPASILSTIATRPQHIPWDERSQTAQGYAPRLPEPRAPQMPWDVPVAVAPKLPVSTTPDSDNLQKTDASKKGVQSWLSSLGLEFHELLPTHK
mmetsp:Transcript_77772/g.137160  ORF Transcript_77772/g.137160 Transcript_77772/m.137160 type:complete len:412 (+) Transcript_77772:50-1285(+)